MEKIRYILFSMVGVLLFACDSFEPPTPDDHFLNYEIPEVAVEQDFVVGAYYNSFTWDTDLTEVPAAGQYESQLGDPTAYNTHITDASTGGIDYFIFNLRSAVDQAQFSTDSAFIATLHTASNAGQMNFALSYNFGAMNLADGRRIEGEGYVDDMIADFELMENFFNQPNYMKVDGKNVVLINGAHNLHSDDNVALMAQLRAAVSSELYIIGRQTQWTPPLRYDFRFVDAVDAVSHESYVRGLTVGTHYSRYSLFHQVVDQALTYSQETLQDHGLDYVPQISPSFNETYTKSNTRLLVTEKDPEFFKTFCNIAKRSSSANRMVIVDSFNNWNFDMQLEPSQNYSNEYLQILRSEFKVN
ncbi:MAG: glycoside hydrolase family 99-like domain-containing protein [Cyclobacteriaceae bacterium]